MSSFEWASCWCTLVSGHEQKAALGQSTADEHKRIALELGRKHLKIQITGWNVGSKRHHSCLILNRKCFKASSVSRQLDQMIHYGSFQPNQFCDSERVRKESAAGLLTFSQVCDPWAQKENWNGAGNNQSRVLLTLTSSCPAATQTSWCGTKTQWSTIWRQCWTPGGRRWSLVLCCQPLLGSPPGLCLPCGTKKLMSLGTAHNSLCVGVVCPRRAHTCKYTPSGGK